MHPAVADPVSVAIFAKAPIPGFAKTRLIPKLGPEGAALLQARLIERAVSVACTAAVGPVSLWCTPTPEHALFREVAARFPVVLHQQSDGDLEPRLSTAFQVLAQDCAAIAIGTDCVVLEPRHLQNAADLLRNEYDAVFFPVEDGGYILVGLRRPAPNLFHEIPWNTDRVMAETRSRACSLGLRVAEPEVLWDIDLPEDYDRAVALGALQAVNPMSGVHGRLLAVTTKTVLARRKVARRFSRFHPESDKAKLS